MSSPFSLTELVLRAQTDQRLCVLIADGHVRAFAVLVDRHRASLTRTGGRIAGDDQAEDVVQEALLRAWRALESGARIEHVPAWLHQIVRNTALSQLAREHGVRQPLSDELAERRQVDDHLEERELARALLTRIAELPDRQRTALIETELAGRSRRAIATELGLSEGAVRQLVHRARSSVRVTLTALTPYPLIAWIARHGPVTGAWARTAGAASPGGGGRSTLLESLGAGSAVSGGALLKGGATIIAVGALGGGLAWHALSHGRLPPSDRATPRHAAVRASSRPTLDHGSQLTLPTSPSRAGTRQLASASGHILRTAEAGIGRSPGGHQQVSWHGTPAADQTQGDSRPDGGYGHDSRSSGDTNPSGRSGSSSDSGTGTDSGASGDSKSSGDPGSSGDHGSSGDPGTSGDSGAGSSLTAADGSATSAGSDSSTGTSDQSPTSTTTDPTSPPSGSGD